MKNFFLLGLVAIGFSSCGKTEYCNCNCDGTAVDETGATIVDNLHAEFPLQDCEEDATNAMNLCWQQFPDALSGIGGTFIVNVNCAPMQ